MLQQESSNIQVSDHPFPLSKFNPAKRLRFSTRRMSVAFQGDGVKEVQKMLGSLHSIISGDMPEFTIFLQSYPPISPEPYSK
jgi:hypothetical protein